MVGHRVELDGLKGGAEARGGRVVAAHDHPEAEILESGQIFVHPGAVADHVDGAPRGLRRLHRVDARDAQRAAGGSHEGGENAEESGLARAVRPEESQAVADAELEGDVVEHGGRAVDLAEVHGLDHEVGSGRRRRRATHRLQSRCDQSLIALRRAMRSSMGGCVENSEARPPEVRGLTMNRWAVAGVASKGTCLDAMSSFCSAAGEMRTRGIGLVFARARDGHLDEHGRDGGEDGHEERADRAAPAAALVIAAAPAAEDGRPLRHLGEVRDGARDGGGDGHDERVPVSHVGQLVGEHPAELVLGHDAQDPFGDGHRGVPGISPGGEGVGRVVLDDIDRRYGNVGPGGEVADDAIELRRFRFRHRPRPVAREHDLVGEPVRADVHDEGEDEGDGHALPAADRAAHEHEQAGQHHEKESGLDQVTHRGRPPREC